MSIGSHTWSHRNLAQLSAEDAEADLRRSREVLAERLGAPPRAIAYPWGKLGPPRQRRDVRGGRPRRLRARADLAAARAARRTTTRCASRASAWATIPWRGWPPRSPARSTGTHTCTSGSRRPWPAGCSPRRTRVLSQQPAPVEAATGAPAVDAIITCHNYGRFLAEAIDSVLAQTHPNVTIVVVDDASTDETAEVAARYADRGVRYVHRTTGGAGQARNAGLEVTSSSAGRLPRRRRRLAAAPPGRGRGAPRAPPRCRAGGRPRVRLRRGDAPVEHRPRAARPRLRARARGAADPQRRPQPELGAGAALRARGGRRLQRAAGRAGLGHLAGDRAALPDRLRRRGRGAGAAPHQRRHAAQGPGSHRHPARDRRPPPRRRPAGLEAPAAAARGRLRGLPARRARQRDPGRQGGRPALRDRGARARPLHPRPPQAARWSPGCSSRSGWWRVFGTRSGTTLAWPGSTPAMRS